MQLLIEKPIRRSDVAELSSQHQQDMKIRCDISNYYSSLPCAGYHRGLALFSTTGGAGRSQVVCFEKLSFSTFRL